MDSFFKTFRNDDRGAIAADWVVLASVVVVMGVFAFQSVGTGAQAIGSDVSARIASVDPG